MGKLSERIRLRRHPKLSFLSCETARLKQTDDGAITMQHSIWPHPFCSGFTNNNVFTVAIALDMLFLIWSLLLRMLPDSHLDVVVVVAEYHQITF